MDKFSVPLWTFKDLPHPASDFIFRGLFSKISVRTLTGHFPKASLGIL